MPIQCKNCGNNSYFFLHRPHTSSVDCQHWNNLSCCFLGPGSFLEMDLPERRLVSRMFCTVVFLKKTFLVLVTQELLLSSNYKYSSGLLLISLSPHSSIWVCCYNPWKTAYSHFSRYVLYWEPETVNKIKNHYVPSQVEAFKDFGDLAFSVCYFLTMIRIKHIIPGLIRHITFNFLLLFFSGYHLRYNSKLIKTEVGWVWLLTSN